MLITYTAKMRGDDDVISMLERGVGRKGFGLEDVEPGAVDLPFL